MESSYVFDNNTRIADDQTYLTQNDAQSVKAATYSVQNYYKTSCDVRCANNFALAQPNVFFSGVNYAGENEIDKESELLNGSVLTQNKCKLSLQQRPFVTVPLMARGKGNIELESQLLFAEQNKELKSVSTVTSMSFENLTLTPQIPVLSKEIQNPKHLIAELAMKGWNQGGSDTRQKQKDVTK